MGDRLAHQHPIKRILMLLNEVQDWRQEELAALKADDRQELAMLKAQQESPRTELLQMRAALATHTAALVER